MTLSSQLKLDEAFDKSISMDSDKETLPLEPLSEGVETGPIDDKIEEENTDNGF